MKKTLLTIIPSCLMFPAYSEVKKSAQAIKRSGKGPWKAVKNIAPPADVHVRF